MRSLLDGFRDYFAYGGEFIPSPLVDSMPPKGIEIAWKGVGLWHGDSLLATLANEGPRHPLLMGSYSTRKTRFELGKTNQSAKMIDPSTNAETGIIDLHPIPNSTLGISNFSHIILSSGEVYRLKDAGASTFYLNDEEDRLLGITKIMKKGMTFRLMVDPSDSRIDPRFIAIISRYCIDVRYSGT